MFALLVRTFGMPILLLCGVALVIYLDSVLTREQIISITLVVFYVVAIYELGFRKK